MKSNELSELNTKLSIELKDQKQNQSLSEEKTNTLKVKLKAKDILLTSKNKLIESNKLNQVKVNDSEERQNLKLLTSTLEQDLQKATDIFAKQIEEMSLTNQSLLEDIEFYEEKIALQKKKIDSLESEISESINVDSSSDISSNQSPEINNDLLNELILELSNSENDIEKINTLNSISNNAINNELLEELILELNKSQNDNDIEKVNTLNAISNNEINNKLLEELIDELNIVNTKNTITKSGGDNTASNDISYATAVEDANIRKEPLPGTEVIGVLKKDELIQVLDEDKNWHKTISIDGIVGYIYSPLLRNNN